MASHVRGEPETPLFVSFKDRQRARRGLHSAASTPARTGPTMYGTPADPMLSSIATLHYGATPSLYDDDFDSGDWVGGGGGAVSASRPPLPLSRPPPMSAATSVSPLRARSTTRSPPRHPTFAVDHDPAPMPTQPARAAARMESQPTPPTPPPLVAQRTTQRGTASSSSSAAAAVPAPARARHVEIISATHTSTSARTAATQRHRAAQDARLARLDHQLRRGELSQVSATAAAAAGTASHAGGHHSHLDSSAPSVASPAVASPLAVALGAHWNSVQSFLDATAPLDGRAPELVGSEAEEVRARIESDLLATLALLPNRAALVVEDAEGVVPLLLAFGIAPVPTVRTQVIALAALKALLLSLPAVCGAAATDAFIEDVLLRAHHGLEALEVAFTAAVQGAEKAHTAPLTSATRSSGTGLTDKSGSPSSSRQARVAELSMADRLMLNVLALLASLTMLSPAFVHACLGTPKSELVRRVVAYLPAAQAHRVPGPITQETALGTFLLALCEQEATAVDVLVAYGGHRLAVDHVRVLFRQLAQTPPDDALTPSLVASLSVYLRLLCRFVRSGPHGFRHLYAEAALVAIVKAGLTTQWGTLVESSGLLLALLLQANPEPERGGRLAQQILSDEVLPGVLAGLLVSTQSTRYAVTAALAWRWLALVEPAQCAHMLSEDGPLLKALLQVILYHNMRTPSTQADSDKTAHGSAAEVASRDVQLLLVESTLILGVAVALGSSESRKRLKDVLLCQLSDVTRQVLVNKLEENVAASADDYLDLLPAVEVSRAAPALYRRPVSTQPSSTRSNSTRTTASATRVLYQTAELASSRSRSRSATSVSADDDSSSEDEGSAHGSARDTRKAPSTSGQPTLPTRRGLVVDSAPSWRRLLLHTLRDLLPVSEATVTDNRSTSATQITVQAGDSVSLRTLARRPGRSAVVMAPTLLATPAEAAENVTLLSEAGRGDVSQSNVSIITSGGGAHGRLGGVRARVLGADTLRYREHPVCQRAKQVMGPRLLQTSIEAVLQLAQSYVDSNAVLPVSAEGAQAARSSLGSSHGRSKGVVKVGNPWAPPTPHTRTQHRRWSIDDLAQDDVLLFVVRADHLVDDIAAAITVVTDHLRYLHRLLQTCPQKATTRRCVLTDLFRNVYPKVHLFLRYIDSQIGQSRAVLQLLSSIDGGFLHSGNVIEVYDSIGVCVGDRPS